MDDFIKQKIEEWYERYSDEIYRFILLFFVVSTSFIYDEFVLDKQSSNQMTHMFEDELLLESIFDSHIEIINIEYLTDNFYQIDTNENPYIIQIKDEETLIIFEYKDTVSETKIYYPNDFRGEAVASSLTVKTVNLDSDANHPTSFKIKGVDKTEFFYKQSEITTSPHVDTGELILINETNSKDMLKMVKFFEDYFN